jgi:hypothetical protein
MFFGIRVVSVYHLHTKKIKWKTLLTPLDGHNFYKSKRNWMIQKLNEAPIEGLQIIYRLPPIKW